MWQRDTSSPLISVSKAGTDSHWAIRVSEMPFPKLLKNNHSINLLKWIVFPCLQSDEKGKFEGIFESLSPVNGLLSGDKVRPVLINSKLPLDVLGKVIRWRYLINNFYSHTVGFWVVILISVSCRFGIWVTLIKMGTWTKKNSQWWAAAILALLLS